MKEIWQQYGTGEKRRMLPLHQAVSWSTTSQDSDQGTYAFETGDGCMGQVGAKHKAMASDQVKYLANFGEAKTLTEQDTALAEKVKSNCWDQWSTFLVHSAWHLLATAKEPETRLEPMEHVWKEHFDFSTLLPCLKPLPPSLLTVCKCSGKFDTRRYGCRADGVLCIIFCHGTMENTSCKNTSH